MEPPYRHYGDYGSEEQEEHRHSHHRPPPPPCPEDEEGEGNFGERREDYQEGGYHRGYERRHGRRGDEEEECFGRGDDEEGFGRRREEDEEGFGRRRGEDDGRFGRGDDEEGYPPERPPHFPHLGFHGRPKPSRHEGPPHDAYAPSDDAPSHSLTHSDSHHSQRPSTEYTYSEPTKEEPAMDAHLSNQMGSLSLDLPQGRLVRIFCKENPAFNLAVDHNSLKMQASNTEDEAQQWIKDASHGVRVKDSYGYPAFSLVNKKTKKMLQHANEQGQQVLLVDYQADLKDDSILWTESQDLGEGFKTVRSASDTLLNLTIFEGNKRVRNGSALVLDTWHKGGHQLWKLFPL